MLEPPLYISRRAAHRKSLWVVVFGLLLLLLLLFLMLSEGSDEWLFPLKLLPVAETDDGVDCVVVVVAAAAAAAAASKRGRIDFPSMG